MNMNTGSAKHMDASSQESFPASDTPSWNMGSQKNFEERGSKLQNETHNALSNHKIAILATHGFEESELFKPLEALKNAGAKVDIISLKKESIQGMKHYEKGKSINADKDIKEAKSQDYDALMLPGGLGNPDALRVNEDAINFTRAFFKAGKPVGVICHGSQLLINANLVKNRTMTGVKSIQIDLENAGAHYQNKEVVVDKGLVSSRTPEDLPAFCKKLVEEIAEGKHEGQRNKTLALDDA